MAKFEPTLSAKIFSNKPGVTEKNLGLLRFPLECSIKYDGWRVVERGGQAILRSLKPVRNISTTQRMAELFKRCAELGYTGLDGEIVVGPLAAHNSMQATTSGLSSRHGTPDITFLVFDSYQHAHLPYLQRYAMVAELVRQIQGEFPWVQLVQQTTVHNLEELLAYEAEVLAQGYEGVMARSGTAPYKFGRSSLLQGILMALKRFVLREAIILWYVEEVENANAATENELGRTHRSSHKENLIPKGRMGAMIAADPQFPKTFSLGGGNGVDHAMRKHVWENAAQYQWRVAQYSYQEIGVVERPRLPKWQGWRSWDDLDPQLAARLLALAAQYAGAPPPDCLPALLEEYRPAALEGLAAAAGAGAA